MAPIDVKAILQLVAGKAAVQLSVPSVTVTLPVGVPLPGEFTLTEKPTVTF